MFQHIDLAADREVAMGWYRMDLHVLLNHHVPCMCPFGCSLMEQKTDWLKGSSGDIMRRLQEREDSAQDIKRCLLGWM